MKKRFLEIFLKEFKHRSDEVGSEYYSAFSNPYRWLRNLPMISTSIAALVLSSIWMCLWLSVMFLSLIFFDLEDTGLVGFALAMYLSVIAEAVIRWFENTKVVVKFAKPYDPNPVGDNIDYSLHKTTFIAALALVSGLMLALAITKGWLELPYFYGVNPNGTTEFWELLFNWIKFLTHPLITYLIISSFLFRTLLYKRTTKMR